MRNRMKRVIELIRILDNDGNSRETKLNGIKLYRNEGVINADEAIELVELYRLW